MHACISCCVGDVAVAVVLTARLSLPGRAELTKLGRSGRDWEVTVAPTVGSAAGAAAPKVYAFV